LKGAEPKRDTKRAARLNPARTAAEHQSLLHFVGHLPFPKVGDDGALPARPERHVPNAIATLKDRLARHLAALMPRCP
jgi:hypothetical protein